jgi:P27 family predicted phage terminase small subunit
MPNWPKPTALRLMQGNPGHRPFPRGEPKAAISAPQPPCGLLAAEKRVWNRVAGRLVESKIMTVLDQDALRLYCQAAVRYERAIKAVRKHGIVVSNRFGQPVLSACWQAAQQEARLMERLLAQFGMTPAGRTRVREAAPPSDQDKWGGSEPLARRALPTAPPPKRRSARLASAKQLLAEAIRRHGIEAALDAAYAAHPERFVRGPPKVARPPAVVAINPPEPETELVRSSALLAEPMLPASAEAIAT